MRKDEAKVEAKKVHDPQAPRSFKPRFFWGSLWVLAAVTSVAFPHLGQEFGRKVAAIHLPFSKGAPTLQEFKNWGLFHKNAGSHISAPEAWKLEEGKKEILVAVIDTGMDSKHPDLSQNLWSKEEEIEQGKNKVKQKVYGWDFVKNAPNPSDEHGHGTHVAGIIGAIANPKAGVSGVVHHISLMPVRYYSEYNSGAVNLKNTIKALNYAIDQGCRIINYSGGGPEYSHEEYLAMRRAQQKGILIVAAAGNESENTDVVENFYYPSAYGLTNTISVAATDIRDQLLASSNWGKKKVDVAAPGENIYSTLPGGKYGYMSGTSQATAFVTGIAALLLSRDPSLTPEQIKTLIKESVDSIPSLKEKLATGGRVNAYKALALLIQAGPKGKEGKEPERPQPPSHIPALIANKPIPVLDFLSAPQRQTMNQ